MTSRPTISQSLLLAGIIILIAETAIAGTYDPGATNTAVKIGNTQPYSGAASALGTIGKTQAAYFKMINEKGGVNGRKIEYVSYDDAYSAPKAVENTRKLVESDEVLFVVLPIGTRPTMATIRYLNEKKVPQLFIAAGGTFLGDYKQYPYSLGWQPPYQLEAYIYGTYLATENPKEKIGVLYSGDDFGHDNIKGLRQGLGDKAGNIVAQVTYDTADTNADAEIQKLRASGATVLVNFAGPNFAAQAIKKISEIGWQPTIHILTSASQSVLSELSAASSKNIISASYLKDPGDPDWSSDQGIRNFVQFVEKFMPSESKSNNLIIYSYTVAQGIVALLKQCGDDLTRANVMQRAEGMKGIELDLLLPGVEVNTSPRNHFPIHQMQLIKFDGTRWVRFGRLMEGKINID
ncbi:branched-chain amino acid transport system substrate-binding protein [Bradyrhizobium japonicum]|uniref:ABC transporter substrate-binding protein n=1 Tax=Bradyrhizobium diazoefficiens TaxID=1355477 RepID=UPI003470E95E